MISWSQFEQRAPDIAGAGTRLLGKIPVAFLGTVSEAGRPRVHPFVPKVVDGRLIAFILDRSPKFADLRRNGWFAIHTIADIADEDEEFYIAGAAHYIDDERAFRETATGAMGFFTEIGEDERLFEFLVDRALWTTWLDFGTPGHRPHYTRWRAG
jgi:hypothetical protein